MSAIACRPTVFYINRDIDLPRRERIEQNFAACRIEAERIPGINGRDLPEELRGLFPPSRLKNGEVGCYASHVLVWQQIVSRDLPYALVLEDDAKFDESAIELVGDCLANLPEGWDYVHLDGRPRRKRFAYRPILKLRDDRYLVRYLRIPDGTVAQLVSNHGARKLLKDVPRSNPVDVDVRMPWRWGLDIYGVSPAPFEQADFNSAIHTLGGNSRHRSWSGSGYRSPSSFLYNLKKLGTYWWSRCALEMAARKLARSMSRRRPAAGKQNASAAP
jgi:glycosyl transferase family 25